MAQIRHTLLLALLFSLLVLVQWTPQVDAAKGGKADTKAPKKPREKAPAANDNYELQLSEVTVEVANLKGAQEARKEM
jgi:hypothetical protein